MAYSNYLFYGLTAGANGVLGFGLWRQSFRAFLMLLSLTLAAAAQEQKGTVVVERFTSTILVNTKTGVDPARNVHVYLPPGYASSGKAYPVVYYFHNIFSGPAQVLADGRFVGLIEDAFSAGAIQEFIVVVGDYTSPTTGSVFENTTATGRWLDYTVEELVPLIDQRFRTLRRRESRGLAGEMMGGRGALMLAMRNPETFGCVYAMNPVGTGTGLLPVQTYPKWEKLLRAKSFAELEGEHISQIFLTFSQAFLPNPDRPPFYCDFLMELRDGQSSYHAENARKMVEGFSLTHLLDQYGSNLLKLRGVAFDWSRYDPIQDHVLGSANLSRKMELFGIDHEAEEYRGVYWTENWRDGGRFAARVLPFFNRHLDFAP
jgi:hypothetical protein